MEAIEFVVPFTPVAQPRQRHRVMKGTGKVFVHNYTPAKSPVNAFKAAAKIAARQAFTGTPLAGPLYLRCVFLMPRPTRLRWKSKPMPRCLHFGKPDLDNLEKALKDALTKIVWHDDGQVAKKETTKFYAAGHEKPACLVFVATLEDE